MTGAWWPALITVLAITGFVITLKAAIRHEDLETQWSTIPYGPGTWALVVLSGVVTLFVLGTLIAKLT